MHTLEPPAPQHTGHVMEDPCSRLLFPLSSSAIMFLFKNTTRQPPVLPSAIPGCAHPSLRVLPPRVGRKGECLTWQGPGHGLWTRQACVRPGPLWGRSPRCSLPSAEGGGGPALLRVARRAGPAQDTCQFTREGRPHAPLSWPCRFGVPLELRLSAPSKEHTVGTQHIISTSLSLTLLDHLPDEQTDRAKAPGFVRD